MIPHPPPRELPHNNVVEIRRNHRAAAVLADEGGFPVGKVGYAERGGWGGRGHRFFPLGAGLYSWMSNLTACVKSWVSFNPNSVAGGVARSSFSNSSSIRNATSFVFLADFFLGISKTLTIFHLNNNCPCNPYNRIIHYTSGRNNATIKTTSGFKRTDAEPMAKLFRPQIHTNEKTGIRFVMKGNGTPQPLADRPGHFYLMDVGNGLYKVGRTDNLKGRQKSHEKQIGRPVKLIHSIAVENMKAAETKVRRMFFHRPRPSYFKYEWMYLTRADIKVIKRLTAIELCDESIGWRSLKAKYVTQPRVCGRRKVEA